MENYTPFIVANEALGDPTQLKSMIDENGYLFLRGVAPKDKLLTLRRDILELCADAGWLDSKTDVMEGIWSGVGPYTEGDPEFMKVYRHVIHLPSFEAAPEDEGLMKVVGKVTGDPVLLHRRKIGRITFPQNVGQTIPAHQDFYYIRGAAETYTLWIPLGDCPIELGGLAVLRGSNKEGFIDHRKFSGRNVPFGLEDDQLPHQEWHASDFEFGDALLFHSHTVHKALPNLTPNKMRLSIDNRYQRGGTAIEPSSMGTHYDL
jgi:ectoine hydroxylase-related dioxygenase (phytanoyl-CoA dioxygenase family)